MRDWVTKGSASEFAYDPEAARARLGRRRAAASRRWCSSPAATATASRCKARGLYVIVNLAVDSDPQPAEMEPWINALASALLNARRRYFAAAKDSSGWAGCSSAGSNDTPSRSWVRRAASWR